MIKRIKNIRNAFYSGPQWRKLPTFFQHRRSLFVSLWFWINSLLDLYLTRHARLILLIWLALSSYSLTMLPDSLPALWLFISAAAAIDLPAKFICPKLSIRRTMPQRVKCAVPFTVRYHITNPGTLPCYALLPDAYMLCDSPADIVPADRNISTDIPRKSALQCEIRYLAKTRGIIRCTRPTAETSYPFHAFKRSIRYGKQEDLIVHPYYRIMPEFSALQFHDLKAVEEMIPAVSIDSNGDGQDFYACRDYHPGDQPKRIHWKKTAQRNKLIVREYEKEGCGKVAVLLPERKTTQSREALAFLKRLFVAPRKKDDLFEGAVSLCASVLQTLEESGIPAELYLSHGNGLRGEEALDALAATGHGSDITVMDELSEDRQIISIFLIVTEYNREIAALHHLPHVNILLTGTDALPPDGLPRDVRYYKTGDLLPEVML